MARSPFGVRIQGGAAADAYRGGRTGGGGLALSVRVDGSASAADWTLAFQGRLQETIDTKVEEIGLAYVKAMKKVVDQGKAKLRADIEQGGFFKAARLAKTWRATTYPKGGDSLEPAGWFSNKARQIIDVFSEGVTIRVQNAQFLAVPLGPAKAIIRRLNASIARSSRDSGFGRNAFGKFIHLDDPVARVEQALGIKLIPIIDPKTNTGVLVADSGLRLSKTGLTAKSQNGVATPLFALTRDVTLRPRIKGRRVLEEIAQSFLGDFTDALGQALPSDARSPNA